MDSRRGIESFFILSLLLLLLSQCVFVYGVDHHYDVIIYGATPSGIAAAIAASRQLGNHSNSVVIVEPSLLNFGGMSVAGGIGLRDLRLDSPFANTIGHEWTMLNAKYYNVSYPVYQPDMNVGKSNFELLLNQANVKVLLNYSISETVPDAVKISNKRIVSFQTTNSDVFYASQFIDASYEGDLARFAKVDYTYGRESQSTYKESIAGVLPYTAFSNFLGNYPVVATINNSSSELIPFTDPRTLPPVGAADQRMMGYSYRLCITTTKSKSVPFSAKPPPHYKSSDFIMLQRYIETLIASKTDPSGPTLMELVDIFHYRNYPLNDKLDLCDSQNAAFTSDAPYINDNYVNTSYANRLNIASQVYTYVLGMMYYLSTDPQVPIYTRNDVNRYGLCSDQWRESLHIPPQLYVREGLRIIGDKVMIQSDFVGGAYKPNSIALGSWWFDIHVVSRTAIKDPKTGQLVVNNEGQRFDQYPNFNEPYEIEYDILLPKKEQIVNLLVPVCNSASHVAYGSIRVEPCFVVLGQSSGIASALAKTLGVAVQDVPVQKIQSVLKQAGINYHAK